MDDAKRQIAEAKEGPRISGMGGATLRAGSIEHRGKKYVLTPDVRAEVAETGNTSSSQGWTFKTQHDNRQTFVTVSGPDWYVDIRGAKGGTSSSEILIIT